MSIVGVPLVIWLLLAVGIGAAYLGQRTPIGRHIYAVGGNERAALLSGVKVRRVKMFVYMLSGGLVMMGVSSFWQTVIKGVVIIAAVVVDQVQQKMQQRMALAQNAVR